ncbi:MAG: glutaredoxin family protein [Anaerolineales bacterium]|jgi:mycoredoxin|nr:glutaredoxin family protein [Anaerolineales bacterium]
MPLSITVYGATDCDDTQRTRNRLRLLNVPFREVNIDHDKEAERFVVFINSGSRSTPTLVIGEGKVKTIMTEPTNAEIDELVIRAGYSIS